MVRLDITYRELKVALHPWKRIVYINQETKQFWGYASLTYQKKISDRTGRLLTRQNIDIFHSNVTDSK